MILLIETNVNCRNDYGMRHVQLFWANVQWPFKVNMQLFGGQFETRLICNSVNGTIYFKHWMSVAIIRKQLLICIFPFSKDLSCLCAYSPGVISTNYYTICCNRFFPEVCAVRFKWFCSRLIQAPLAQTVL